MDRLTWCHFSMLLLWVLSLPIMIEFFFSDKMAVACIRYCGLLMLVSFSDFRDKQIWACTLGTQSRFPEELLSHQVAWSACRLQSLSFDSEITLLNGAPLCSCHSPVICSKTPLYTTWSSQVCLKLFMVTGKEGHSTSLITLSPIAAC